MDATQDRSNRLSVTRAGGQLITDYWDDLFTAREQGKQIVWYNGGALNPFFQAAGLAWCHGEAFAARLAAQRLEGPAQLAGAEYGYNAELCSYARTHLGCSVLTLQSTEGERSGVVGLNDQKELAARLPSPDFFVNNYAGCSTGQQWDGISYRVFGKELPIFNISHPFLWGNKPDAAYLRGQEWEAASRYVADQLRDLISFLEAQTGRPFDYDALSEAMTYIKRAAELRREGLDLCKAKPAPATFWDWIACVAPINFLPGDQALVDYFAGVRDEIAERLQAGVSGVRDEKYRLYFDGIMNWNKLGFLSRKFAEHGAAVLCGRYIHNAFWQEPQLIDTADPVLGMAQHYLLCPTNHGTKTLDYLTLRDCREYDVDGIVFHSTRTCRAFTGPQRLLAKSAQDKLGIPSIFFEGDVADASFYKEEILESRLVAMLEVIDVRRAPGSGADVMSGRYLGVDLGSTTAKAVVTDSGGAILGASTVQMGAVSQRGMQRAVEAALAEAGVAAEDLTGTVATGYGRRLVPGAARTFTEITCHARGTAAMCPGVRLVIDIGGQDSKAITVDADGLVEDFAMNDRCASGTGRFYEVLARALECELDELPALALRGHRDLEVSSMCATFAETEIVSLLAQGLPPADIASSVHRAIAARTLALVAQVGKRTPVVLTGGVARNPAAVRFLAEALHLDVQVPAHPQITGAYGAALLAAESAGRAPDPGRAPDQADADMWVPLFPGPLFPGPLFAGPPGSDRSCTDCDGTIASTAGGSVVELGPAITVRPA